MRWSRCVPPAAWPRRSSSSASERGAGRRAIDDLAKLQRDVSLKLTVITRQLHKQFDRHLDGLGVTRSQWSVIAVVARRPGATQRLIAEVLEMSEAAAGRLIDRLCGEGYLERRAREDDRRAYSIALTDKTRPMLEQIGAIARVHEEAVFAGIDPADLQRMADTLAAIYRNIKP